MFLVAGVMETESIAAPDALGSGFLCRAVAVKVWSVVYPTDIREPMGVVTTANFHLLHIYV